jgi:hypothetical protein
MIIIFILKSFVKIFDHCFAIEMVLTTSLISEEAGIDKLLELLIIRLASKHLHFFFDVIHC